jgi:ribosomal protein L16 Arg81 hydroxylase
MNDLTLSALLNPVAAESFFKDYWERTFLHIARGEPDYYRELLSAEDIDHLISHGDGRYPAVRLAKGGAFFPPEAYTRDVHYGDDAFNGVPDVEKIFTEYLSGATVTLPGLHHSWAPLARFCFELENQLSHVVHTNVYVTPANATGFTTHYDTHDVFILQIAGAKHWQICEPPLALPHRSQPFSSERDHGPTELVAELLLKPGDALYLPRGYIHSTTTSSSYSAHITVGVTVYTWVELASELLPSLISDLDFRHALPAGFANSDDAKSTLASELRTLFTAKMQALDVDVLTSSFLKRVRGSRSRAPIAFRADVSAIGPNTSLKMCMGRQYRLAEEGDHVVLSVEERRVVLPRAVWGTLQAICTGDPFCPTNLPGAVPVAAKLSLARYLHGLGLVTPSRDP